MKINSLGYKIICFVNKLQGKETCGFTDPYTSITHIVSYKLEDVSYILPSFDRILRLLTRAEKEEEC